MGFRYPANRNYRTELLGRVVPVMVLLISVWLQPAWAEQATTQLFPLALTTNQGVVQLEVELARSEEERAKGLQGREVLPPEQGMLFDFGRRQSVTMWMKETLIPLDMLFIDQGGVVIGMHQNAQPHSLSHISSPQPVRAVLEVNGGSIARWGVQVGAEVLGLNQLLHPAPVE